MSNITDDGKELQRRNEAEVTPKNVLPNPWAALVSFVAATSSFSINAGGLIGGYALSAARIGTLSGLEIGRSVLEGILARAGQNVAGSSHTLYGSQVAAGVTNSTLGSLHFWFTQTSFLISSGFQIGSTSLESSLAIANGFLATLNGVFGDTDTSKAIAAIVVLIQREYKSPEGANPAERLTLADLLVAVVSFALLQKWCEEHTEREFVEAGGENVVWDIVVVHDPMSPWNSMAIEDDEMDDDDNDDEAKPSQPRPLSFVSATGENEQFDAYPFDDASSCVSLASTRTSVPVRSSSVQVEENFRQQLMGQVESGAVVHVTSHSVATDVVTVEIAGAFAPYVEPPPGYNLIAFEGPNDKRPNAHRFIFRKSRKRRRDQTFEVSAGPQALHRNEAIPRVSGGDANQQVDEHSLQPFQNFDAQPSTRPKPVVANESRARIGSPSPQRPDLLFDESSSQPANVHDAAERSINKPFRKTFRESASVASVKNLVDFWSREKRSPSRQKGGLNKNIGSAQKSTQRLESFQENMRSSIPENAVSRDASSRTRPDQILNGTAPPAPHRAHSRTYSLRSETSDSVVLHAPRGQLAQEQIAAYLYRAGDLPWTFPRRPLAQNLSRYCRFSLASYGATFLRLVANDKLNATAARDYNGDGLAEHHSFSTYTGLPASTVLLSSFVDPEGGTDASGDTGTGMPLVHYISLDHEAKAVVLTIRGTLGYQDLLTDSQCDDDDLVWEGKTFRVHKGILASARRMLTMYGGRVLATIKASLEEFEEYGLVFCGHSLGGGVAAMLAILLAEPTSFGIGGETRCFMTSNLSVPRSACQLPARPIHAYAYGSPACVSPGLQCATRGLITTVAHSKDFVPNLCLGALHNAQAAAIALKTDSGGAKAELRRRTWRKLTNIVQDKIGFGAIAGIFDRQWAPSDDEDQWPLAAMKSLRAAMQLPQLVPPGDVFLVESSPVLAKHAFVESKVSSNGKMAAKPTSNQSYRPATRIKLTHVLDVETKFHEIKFGPTMFTDHLPGRYESVLATLERGVCC